MSIIFYLKIITHNFNYTLLIINSKNEGILSWNAFQRLKISLKKNFLMCQMYKLFVLTLTSSFRLLLTLYRRLFISFSLTNFLNDTASCTLFLKSSQCTFEGFIIFNSDFSHLSSLPSAIRQGFVSLRYLTIIH